MNNSTATKKPADSFEKIARDAISLLTDIVTGLASHEEVGAQIASMVIGIETAAFCERAIALGGE